MNKEEKNKELIKKIKKFQKRYMVKNKKEKMPASIYSLLDCIKKHKAFFPEIYNKAKLTSGIGKMLCKDAGYIDEQFKIIKYAYNLGEIDLTELIDNIQNSLEDKIENEQEKINAAVNTDMVLNNKPLVCPRADPKIEKEIKSLQ
jgi:hypothetical protein